MTFVVLCMSLFVFIVIFTSFFEISKKSDNKNRRLYAISGRYKNDFDEDLEKPFFQRFLFPIFTSAMKNLSRLLPKNKGKETKQTEKNLKLARINLTVNEYNAARMMFAGAFILASIIVTIFIPMDSTIKIVIVLFSTVLSVIIPLYVVKFRISSRQEGIRNQLADVMDLLSVTIEAGLGFDSALIRIGERLDGPLIEELNIVLVEIQLGKPRRDALKSLSERSTVEELNSFVGSMIQAEHLGIPIKNVLNTQAKQIRVSRKQKAEEKAMKAPVKMMLPLVVFIFPVLFLILLGPTVLKLMEQFGGK